MTGACLSAMLMAPQAFAQQRTSDPSADGLDAAAAGVQLAAVGLQATDNETAEDQASQEIVVTGIRNSLEQAAQIKRTSSQVVDAIVAEDIGKFPDPTTSAALQRIPGVQVSVDNNNELGNVRVRGLPDILTTVNGREVFTTTGRSFNLHYIPAQALAQLKVYKSQTPDLIEGGLAGIVDLDLNRPFNFDEPTLNVTLRNNYGVRVDATNPEISALVTDSWDTGIGKIGVLVNGSYQRNNFYRAETQIVNRRSSGAAPINTPGYLIPNIIRNWAQSGTVDRAEVNGSIQWQASPALEVYIDGLYADEKETGSNTGANAQAFTAGATLTDVTASDNCFQTRVRPSGENPVVLTDAEGNKSLQPFTVQTLCEVTSATLVNPIINLTTQTHHYDTYDKLVGGGIKYDRDGWHGGIDVSYQKSRNTTTDITADIGKRLPSLTLEPDVNNVPQYSVPGNALLTKDGLTLRNAFQQRFSVADGELFAAQGDLQKDFDGILKNIKIGARFADRKAESHALQLITGVPGGNDAVLVADSGLPADFLALAEPAPGLNHGSRYYIPNPDFLLSERGLDVLRQYVGLPTGRPDFQPLREFDDDEQTLAGYAEANYDIPISGAISLDGLIGGRVVQTKRMTRAFQSVNVPATGGAPAHTEIQPVSASSTETDFLPNVTTRLKFGGGLQARFIYSKTIRRPEFAELNPALTLAPSANPFVQNQGNAGNPNLKQEEAENYDATLEYYFPRGYIAVAGYYRSITNRVINGAAIETYDGVDYNVRRPRNIGKANLKGVEVNGQYFLDFLPGVLSGLGVMGAFTYLDSEVKGDDPLAGFPLQGVSKYNYTAGLLYDHAGVSGRLVYTHRSKYFSSDETGSTSLRPIPSDRIDDVYTPVLLGVTRPNGRLDFSIGYEVSPAFHIDIGGTNILKGETKSYYGSPAFNYDDFLDETTYSIGVRVRL